MNKTIKLKFLKKKQNSKNKSKTFLIENKQMYNPQKPNKIDM